MVFKGGQVSQHVVRDAGFIPASLIVPGFADTSAGLLGCWAAGLLGCWPMPPKTGDPSFLACAYY